MNLKKYTKAELISKINNIKQNNNKEGIFNNFMTLIMLVKSFLLKITLITLIIKIFRRYSIFRKIFTVINTILFSIFGLSLIDIYQIEFLSNFFNNIIDLFSKFHNSILDLFGKKIETPIENPSNSMRGIQQSSTGIQTSNDSSNKIIERFTKLIHKEEEVMDTSEVIQEDNNPYYKNKYVIIAGLLILGCITWYFYDDIRPVGSSILAWINISRSWSKSDPDGSNESISRNNQSNNKSLKDRVWEKFYGKPKDGGDNIPPIKPSNTSNTSISLGETSKTTNLDQYYPEISKGKGIDLNNYSLSELERRGIKPSIINVDNTAINFRNESYKVLNNILIIQDCDENDKIDKDILKVAYLKEKDNLLKLSEMNPELYQQFSEKAFHKIVLDNFKHMEKSYFPEDVKHLSTDNYQEAEIAANQEKDIWSDKGNSPQQPLSPELVAETAMETFNKPKLVVETIDNNQKTEENVNTNETLTPLDKLNKYWEGLKSKTKEILNKDENINNNVKTEDTILEEDGLLLEEIATEEVSTLALLKDKDNPKIEISKHSTPEDMKDYFIKEESNNTVEETKPIEDSKIEIIHSEELDNLAKTLTPRIKDDYIEPDNTKIFENLDPELLPEKEDKKTKLISSFKNIKDNQKAEGLFSQETTSLIKEELSKENDLLYSKDNINKTLEERPHIVEALKAIKSKRLEYGSPSVANIGLPKGDLSPLIQNENISNLPNDNEGIDDSNPEKEVKLPLHNWNEEIKFNINKGQPYERFIDIELGENQKDIYKILIITNDGMSNSINPNTVVSLNHKNSFKWDVKGTSNSYWRDLDIYSISIIDKSRVSQEIYRNNNIKFLKVFKDNITKSFR